MRKCDARLIEQAKEITLGSHCVGAEAMLALAEMYNNKLIDGFNTIYAMGFIKGQRAAENKGRAAR